MTKWAVAAAMLLPQLMAAKVIKVLAIGNSFCHEKETIPTPVSQRVGIAITMFSGQ